MNRKYGRSLAYGTIAVMSVLYIFVKMPSAWIAGCLTLAVGCGGILSHWDKITVLHRWPKGRQRMLVLLIAMVMVPSVMALPFLLFAASYGGQGYSDNAWDRLALRRVVRPYDPVPLALAAHYSRHGSYPSQLDELDLSLPLCATALSAINTSTKHHLSYRKLDEWDYTLQLKMSWDADLTYSTKEPRWIYEPGDGAPAWPID